jgi:hypothetical protein
VGLPLKGLGTQDFQTQIILSGQVGGVAISSAIFQSNLEGELRSRIHRPDAEDVRPTQTHYIN